MKHRREAHFILFVAEAFVALTSIVCGVGLAVGVIQFPPEFLQDSPFSNYTLPGLLMAIVVGGSALWAAVALGAGRSSALALAALAGLILLLFEVVEITVIDRNTGAWLPLVVTLQAAYSALGLIIVGLAAVLWEAGRRQQSMRMRHAASG